MKHSMLVYKNKIELVFENDGMKREFTLFSIEALAEMSKEERDALPSIGTAIMFITDNIGDKDERKELIEKLMDAHLYINGNNWEECYAK